MRFLLKVVFIQSVFKLLNFFSQFVRKEIRNDVLKKLHNFLGVYHAQVFGIDARICLI